MRLLALLWVAILTTTCRSDVIGHHQDLCEDCHQAGAWFPLFHPSQIISSELPEHEQYRSHEAPPPLTYATASPQVSREVPQGVDHGYRKSSSQEVPQGIYQEYRKSSSQEVPQGVDHGYRKSSSQEVPQGVDHGYRKSSSQEVPQGVDHGYRKSSSQEVPQGVDLGYRKSSSQEVPQGVDHGYRKSSSQEVPQGVDHGYRKSSSQEVPQGVYQEYRKSSSQEVPQGDPGSREPAGVDSPVRSYDGQGGHRVEWDHYGDITTVATVYNSLEGGGAPGEDRSDADTLGPGGRSDMSENVSGVGRGDAPLATSEQETSGSVSQEEAFFDNGNFFEEKSQDSFPESFDSGYLYSGEHHHHSNSIEDFHSYENFARKPVATSYSSISSVFESRPIPRARDLLHPHLAFNDISHYIDLPRMRNRTRTRQYLVHEPQSREDAGVLHISHISPRHKTGPSGHRPTSYVPLDHPVYRYVKVHGGMNRKPQSRSTLLLDDIHPQLRSKFPFKYLRPRVHVQNHESFVKHVIPTKDPFSDSYFKESQKIENLQPPPLGQTLYLFKKKPSPVEMKSIARRRHTPDYMYVVRRNKKHQD